MAVAADMSQKMNVPDDIQLIGRHSRSGVEGNIDEKLIALLFNISHRDHKAFATLYKLSSRKLYGIVNRILRREQLANDALQESYVRIWLNASKFDPNLGAPLTWMAVIARRQALDMARRSKHLWFEDVLEHEHPSEEIDPLGLRVHRETLRSLLLCLSKLDAKKREILMYAYYRGASRKELSLHFGIPVPTIKTKLRRALAELKETM